MIILASKSPRRRELLSALGYDFEIHTKETDEGLPEGMHPKVGVEILSVRKAMAVLCDFCDSDYIIASDTLVEIDGEPLGKPIDEADAVRMLMRLSGNPHRVHSGVAVLHNGKIYSGSDTSTVIFRPFDESEAHAYVMTGEPMDKAGAYGIQGLGGRLVDKVEGEIDTIVGLPCKLLKKLMAEAENEKE